jgi:hypothetical protein
MAIVTNPFARARSPGLKPPQAMTGGSWPNTTAEAPDQFYSGIKGLMSPQQSSPANNSQATGLIPPQTTGSSPNGSVTSLTAPIQAMLDTEPVAEYNDTETVATQRQAQQAAEEQRAQQLAAQQAQAQALSAYLSDQEFQSAFSNFGLGGYGSQFQDQLIGIQQNPDTRQQFLGALSYYQQNPNFQPFGTTRYGSGYSPEEMAQAINANTFGNILQYADYGISESQPAPQAPQLTISQWNELRPDQQQAIINGRARAEDFAPRRR